MCGSRARTRLAHTLQQSWVFTCLCSTIQVFSAYCQCFITKLICAVEAQRVLYESYLKALLIKRLVISQTKTVTSAVCPDYSHDSAFSLIVVSIVVVLYRRRFLFIYLTKSFLPLSLYQTFIVYNLFVCWLTFSRMKMDEVRLANGEYGLWRGITEDDSTLVQYNEKLNTALKRIMTFLVKTD